MERIIADYKALGIPLDQNSLVNMLKEIQQENGGTIPAFLLPILAETFSVKESFLLAVIRRIPSLRLGDSPLLQICAGPNCRKHASLSAWVQKLEQNGITVKFVPCMRLCGKGPNIKWDGTLYHHATPKLLQQLIQQSEK